MGERKKVSLRILGRAVSIKVPKLRLFRKKVCSEPEWSWQAAAPTPAPASRPSPARTRQRQPRQQHRYLSVEQVSNIQAWLTQLPKPGDVSQLDLLEEYLADLSDLSVSTSPSPPRQCQSIQTDIF